MWKPVNFDDDMCQIDDDDDLVLGEYRFTSTMVSKDCNEVGRNNLVFISNMNKF